MRHILYASAGAAGVAMIVVASVALGSTGGQQVPSTGSPISIANRLRSSTNKGTFRMVVDARTHTGTATVRPTVDSNKVVGGQVQTQIHGDNTLKSTEGTLSLVFRGVIVGIKDIDPTKEGFGAGYGTWQIQRATGIYKGWKGGGRWADASTPSTDNLEWVGFVTH
jgi:hypothetical protein